MNTQLIQQQTTNKKDFLSLVNYSQEEILSLLEEAKKMKSEQAEGVCKQPLKGKILGMVFEKSSTRTRVSFEAGMLQLGGHAMFLSNRDLQIGRGEPISDTAKVLSEYVDAIMIRTHAHSTVVELAQHASVPVINGLSDLDHPCQALADLLTIQECKGNLQGVKLAYIGDGNNVAHALLVAAAKTGMFISIATPPGYEPATDVVDYANQEAQLTGGSITITHSPSLALTDADVVYSDVWTSMGQEEENEVRMKAFADYQVNASLVKFAKKDYTFMHCLPAHRGEEVTHEVIDGEHSVIFQQAGNRLHAQKALLIKLMS